PDVGRQDPRAVLCRHDPRLAADPAGLRDRGRAVPDHGAGVFGRPCRGSHVRHRARERGRTELYGALMPNIQRGEISALIGGEERVLCLTLGALAELEARLMAGDLVGLSERFASGRVSARDLTAIIGAGLRGGGNALTADDLARMTIEGGLVGAADIAARLLRATFGETA